MENKYGTTYAEIRAKYLRDISTCPHCGAEMTEMGLDFKAPKRRDVEAWRIVRELVDHGFNFHSCGCGVGYTPPANRSELPAWLERQAANSSGEKLLRFILAKGSRQRATAA